MSWSLKEMVCCENIDMVVVLDATPEEIQCMDALVIVYSSDARNYDFGMDALVIVYSSDARNYDFGMDALVIVYSSDARNYDFGMDALVIVCFRNTNVIMILAWMLW